jgi:hypothetical protein
VTPVRMWGSGARLPLRCIICIQAVDIRVRMIANLCTNIL